VEEGGRVRGEGDRDHAAADAFGEREQLAMTDVHAIEVADHGRVRRQFPTGVGQR
jgi:hypothetical protein